MSTNIEKRSGSVIRYLRIVLREAVIWNYTPMACVPVVWFALFFEREYYADGSNDLGIMPLVYGALLLLGICMGMVAAGHLLNGRKGDAYLMIPIGRRCIFAVRLLTMLVLCAFFMLLTYVFFYLFTGMDDPAFYKHPEYIDVIAPSEVESAAFLYEGVKLWCVFGVRAFILAFVPFVLGYAVGAFCAVLSSFPVFSALHAIILLALNGASAIPLAHLDYCGISICAYSPLWFVGFFNALEYRASYDALIRCWVAVAVIFMLLAVLTVPAVRTERRGNILSSRKFIIFYAVFFAISAAVFLLSLCAPEITSTVIGRIFGIEYPVFGS